MSVVNPTGSWLVPHCESTEPVSCTHSPYLCYLHTTPLGGRSFLGGRQVAKACPAFFGFENSGVEVKAHGVLRLLLDRADDLPLELPLIVQTLRARVRRVSVCAHAS